MTKDEALKMAELALDINDECECGRSEYQIGKLVKSLQACKEALAQPAEQAKADFDVMAYGQSFMLDGKHIPLSEVYEYPAPSWQGLSDDEAIEMIEKCTDKIDGGFSYLAFARAIEQALKEKNYE